jgi:hypothetical protein
LLSSEPEKTEYFDDDIGLAGRELNSFSSAVGLIDTQNKIWFKIITREKQNYDEKKTLYMNRVEPSTSVTLSSGAKSVILFAPKMLAKGIEKINEKLKDDRRKEEKVRPPRFVNFRMELEPYNEQKALALQILNDINLNMLTSETIDKIFNFK